ncbi:hypothetical protein PoB_004622000 [Plakobranchus ocellatus]|uniref:Uncharacterized protein n=1 Tax=Plakobranchus ocellatus TaxID=259542 RepID=A0AAV4BJR2_9GAST|nr:hypothetical protein PoB_004622000 [Plakobranchus ocellatus]
MNFISSAQHVADPGLHQSINYAHDLVASLGGRAGGIIRVNEPAGHQATSWFISRVFNLSLLPQPEALTSHTWTLILTPPWSALTNPRTQLLVLGYWESPIHRPLPQAALTLFDGDDALTALSSKFPNKSRHAPSTSPTESESSTTQRVFPESLSAAWKSDAH